MAAEEVFLTGDVFAADGDLAVNDLVDLIDHNKGLAMRDNSFDSFLVEHVLHSFGRVTY